MAAKVRAAVAARSSDDFLIIARTDARAVEGLPAALERARRYREAGADILFVEAPESVAEIEQVAHELAGVPLLFNYAEGGRTPPVTHAALHEFGFKIVIFPIGTLLAATGAMRALLERIREQGSPIDALPSLLAFDEFLRVHRPAGDPRARARIRRRVPTDQGDTMTDVFVEAQRDDRARPPGRRRRGGQGRPSWACRW